MGRAPCCDKANVKKGPWSPDEDSKLKAYIEEHGTGGNWIALPQKIGLKRCGKSCRLRWLNYLRPNIKHGGFSEEEENFICSLYTSIGSRWSVIAAQLPGRTDNDIKNYWNTRLKNKLLGKQHKEQQARRASPKREMNRESESLKIPEAINQRTPYWPELTAHFQGKNSYQDTPFMDQESTRNLLAKQGGRFYDDLQQSSTPTNSYPLDGSCSQDHFYGSFIDTLYSSTSMNSMESSCSQLPSCSYSISGGGPSPNMFRGLDGFEVELEDFAYSNPQRLEGLESFYGTIDMANSSSTGACSGKSSSWGSTGPLVCPQLVPQFENCLQDSSFAHSIDFGAH